MLLTRVVVLVLCEPFGYLKGGEATLSTSKTTFGQE